MNIYKHTKQIPFYAFKVIKIMLMVSLFLIHLSEQTNKKPEGHQTGSNGYSGPDFSQEIKDTIKRYSRDTNQPIGEIRQKLFARTSANMKSANIIMESKNYK